MADAPLKNINVNIIVETVEQINKARKTVHSNKGRDVGYDKLIIATGSSPAILPIPGIEKENVFLIKKEVPYLQTMLDAINQAKDIVIIGGGFIGAEFADECKRNRDNNVTIVEKLPHLPPTCF